MRKTDKIKHLHVDRDRHRKVRFYYREGNGPRIRLPTDLKSEEFKRAYKEAQISYQKPIEIDTPDAPLKRQVGKGLKSCISSARSRAKKKGLPFEIDINWLLDRAEKFDLKCELSGIPFYSNITGQGKSRAFSPSLDRIDCTKGYTEENVRIVLFAVNVMLSDWGEDTLFKIVSKMRGHKQALKRSTHQHPELRKEK